MFLRNNQNNGLIILVVVFLLVGLSLLYSCKLASSYNYDNDFGRDLYDMLGIVRGNFRLLGPGLSFGGLISGPYYYYLFSLPLFMTGENPASLLYFSVLIHVLSLVVLFIFLAKEKEKQLLSSLFFVLWLATSSYLIFSVRNPGNAFSYFWLIILFFTLFLRKDRPFVPKGHYVALGVLAGIIGNFHFVNLLFFVPFGFIWLVKIRQERKQALLYFSGLLISFLPQLLFELRHSFVMLKNTFQVQSYLRFINKELPTTLPTSHNPITNLFLITNYIKDWFQPSFILVLLAVLMGYWFHRHSSNKRQKVIVLSSLAGIILLSILARYQFVFHYFLPFILWLQLALWLVLDKTKIKPLIFGLLFLVNIWHFPKNLYQSSTRSLDDYAVFSRLLIEKKFLKPNDKYNLFVVRETPFAIAGWEYRFWLKKYGFEPMSSFDYNQSEKMLVVSEGNNKMNFDNLKTWEFEQFGEYNIDRKEKIGDREVAVLISTRR
jgi:hypothetical protein